MIRTRRVLTGQSVDTTAEQPAVVPAHMDEHVKTLFPAKYQGNFAGWSRFMRLHFETCELCAPDDSPGKQIAREAGLVIPTAVEASET